MIGIAGGLGPRAHIELEHRLLAAVEGASTDQDYPPWLVSSLPGTPDRTAALLGNGPSPVLRLVESLRRLEGRAHFAVIACNTAHAFLDEVLPRVSIPVLHMVEEAATEAALRFGRHARIGLLATTGTLVSGVFQEAAARRAPGLEIVTPFDLEGGEQWQEELVMRPIYGAPSGADRQGGIKAGTPCDANTGRPHDATLREAVARLAAAGIDGVFAGCTEIPLALGRGVVEGVPVLDPLDAVARAAIRAAQDDRAPTEWMQSRGR